MTTYIPNNLRALRKAAGMRQQDLAGQLGSISIDCISRWEKGLTYPHLTTLGQLCQFFKVSPADLYPDLFGAAQRLDEHSVKTNEPFLDLGPCTLS